jgi:hypothetical protein
MPVSLFRFRELVSEILFSVSWNLTSAPLVPAPG